MARVAKEKVLTITWRDENYGRVYDAVSFRAMLEPFPSETENRKLARIYKKQGFDFNGQRYCWMAEYKPEDTALRLVEALKEAGYTVINKGAQPKILTEAKAAVETAVADDEAPAPKM